MHRTPSHNALLRASCCCIVLWIVRAVTTCAPQCSQCTEQHALDGNRTAHDPGIWLESLHQQSRVQKAFRQTVRIYFALARQTIERLKKSSIKRAARRLGGFISMCVRSRKSAALAFHIFRCTAPRGISTCALACTCRSSPFSSYAAVPSNTSYCSTKVT